MHAPSAKWSRGRGARRQISSIKEWTTAYRASAGLDSWADAHRVTIVGNWNDPAGESGISRQIEGDRMVKARKSVGKAGEDYRHPTSDLPLRPEIGT